MATDMWTYDASLRDALGRYDLRGFKVVARDADVGKVDDASYEEPGENFLVVDTGSLFFGKKVLLPAGVVRRIDVERKEVLADVTRDEVKNAPEYDSDRGIDDDLRTQLASHYGLERGERQEGERGERSERREQASSSEGLEDIRTAEPVENTIHNLVQTLSVKLDSAARYGLYQDDARKDGYEDCAEMFGRLEQRERDSIADLLTCLRERLGPDTARREGEGRTSA